MLHVSRRALVALVAAGLLLPAAAGTVSANPGTYTATFCYDANNVDLGGPAIVIDQSWSGMEVDTVTGGEGAGKKGGFSFLNQITPATSGEESDALVADPHAKTVGAEVFDQGTSVGSMTVNKIKGSWVKTLPAC